MKDKKGTIIYDKTLKTSCFSGLSEFLAERPLCKREQDEMIAKVINMLPYISRFSQDKCKEQVIKIHE